MLIVITSYSFYANSQQFRVKKQSTSFSIKKAEIDLQSGIPKRVAVPCIKSIVFIYPPVASVEIPEMTYKISILSFTEEILYSWQEKAEYEKLNYIQGVQNNSLPNFNQFKCCTTDKKHCTKAISSYNWFYTHHLCQFPVGSLKSLSNNSYFWFMHENLSSITEKCGSHDKIEFLLKLNILDSAIPDETVALTISTIHETKTNVQKREMALKLSNWILYHNIFSITHYVIYFRDIHDLIWIRYVCENFSKKATKIVYWPGFNSSFVQRANGYYDQYFMVMHMLKTHLSTVQYAFIGNDYDEFLKVSKNEEIRSIGNYLSKFNFKGSYFKTKTVVRTNNPGEILSNDNSCDKFFDFFSKHMWISDNLDALIPKGYFSRKSIVKISETPCADVHFACGKEHDFELGLDFYHLKTLKNSTNERLTLDTKMVNLKKKAFSDLLGNQPFDQNQFCNSFENDLNVDPF
jgi:hypothetical protein